MEGSIQRRKEASMWI